MSPPREPQSSPSVSPATRQHPSDEPGWIRPQREAGEKPEQDEAASLDLLKRELGATEHGHADPQAEFIRLWNADVYAQAKARREAGAEKERALDDEGPMSNDVLTGWEQEP